MRRTSILALGTLAALALAPAETRAETSFKDKVQPVLEKHCVECHKAGGEGLESSGLDLTSYDALMKGTKYGPVVSAGDPFTSNLMVLLDGRAMVKMPHNRAKLSVKDRDTIRKWIKQGAKDN